MKIDEPRGIGSRGKIPFNRMIIEWLHNVKRADAHLPRKLRDGAWGRSFREMRNARHLTTQAMLLAMQVLLNLFIAIQIGDAIRISFGYLALAATGMLLGPVPAMVNGALADILGFILKPTGEYHPGFTLSGIVAGLFYGIAFYKRPIRLKHVMLAKLAVDVIVNIGLNTLWLYQLRGMAIVAKIPGRLGKNILQYFVDVALLLPLLLKLQSIRGKKSMF